MSPFDESELLDLGLGITNIVRRTTARADELTDEEVKRGAETLARKIRRYRPRFVAVLGMQAYRLGFGRAKARVGRQDHLVGSSVMWLLPNPSGLNAHYQLPDLAAAFGELRREAFP